MAAKVPNSEYAIHKSNKTCPSCRGSVTKVTEDFRANNLVEFYLKQHPSKARSQDDIEELDAAYKRGETVFTTQLHQ